MADPNEAEWLNATVPSKVGLAIVSGVQRRATGDYQDMAVSELAELRGTVALIDRVARPTVDAPDARSDCFGEFVERCCHT